MVSDDTLNHIPPDDMPEKSGKLFGAIAPFIAIEHLDLDEKEMIWYVQLIRDMIKAIRMRDDMRDITDDDAHQMNFYVTKILLRRSLRRSR